MQLFKSAWLAARAVLFTVSLFTHILPKKQSFFKYLPGLIPFAVEFAKQFSPLLNNMIVPIDTQ